MNLFLKFFVYLVLLMYSAKGLSRIINYKSGFNLQQVFYSSISKLRMQSDKYTVLADNSNVEKPILDDRSYRLIKLNSNDLHVLIINDASTDKAAASLDVNVGSFADKNYQVPGLAHFCEHLLFMGTSKYPEENEYSSYLSKHSGHSNAYTAAEHTNYYFELSSDYLEGALDRFSQFFISPLFSKSCKDREIKAVDSENKKNLQNDMWRFYQLDKLTSNPQHPYNGFSTGNYETLHEEPTSQGLNVRDILLDFYKNHYSSNLMSLVILGKEDLDTLTSWAIDKFSEVPNSNLPRPNYNGELIYNPDHLGKIIKAKPIMDSNKLELSFMVPSDQEANWDSKPASYYSHLLGHESSGSILHYLKQKGWVNELSAGNMKVCQGNSIFVLEFDLTPNGLKNWEAIVVNVFEYLKLVLNGEPKLWLWEELSNMSTINFKFKQKQRAAQTVSKMSNSLYKFTEGSYIPPQYLLSSSILREFKSQEIKEYGSFLNPDNFRILLTSQSLPDLDKSEHWYGTQYSYESISNNLKDQIQSAETNENFHYPIPNEFIPKDFTVSKPKLENPLPHPYLIEDNNKFQVWYKQDDQFQIPKGAIEIVLHLANANTSCKSSIYTMLLSQLIDDELNEIVYYASMVGISFTINHWRDGLLIRVSGYNDKLPVLLEQILQKLITFKPKEDRFEVFKFKLNQEFKNFGFEVPYSQIGTHFLTLLNDKTYPYDLKIDTLNKEINFGELLEFSTNKIWEQGVFGEVLIQGNFNDTKAFEISRAIQGHFTEFKTIRDSQEEINEIVKLKTHIVPSNQRIRYEVALQDKNNINSCIEYFIQISDSFDDVRLRVLTDLLGTVIHEPCFNQLRTKEQLGYVVFSGTRLTRTTLGFRILIQSERSSEYLEYRIEEFINQFDKFVKKGLTDENFAKFKQALKDKKLTKLKNLSEEVSKFWNSIISGYYDFQEREKHVEVLESITKDEFIKFYNDYISADSNFSSRIIVHLKSPSVPKLEKLKLLHSSINNYIYRNEFSISSDVLDSLIEANADDVAKLVEVLTNAIAEKKENNVSNKDRLKSDLSETINRELTTPVPPQYPSGKLVENVDQFKSTYPVGDIPRPVEPLSNFYYSKQPEDHAHL